MTTFMLAQYSKRQSPLGKSYTSTCDQLRRRLPTSADPVFFHSSELLTEGPPQLDGESSASEQLQGCLSSAAHQPQEQPLTQVRQTIKSRLALKFPDIAHKEA